MHLYVTPACNNNNEASIHLHPVMRVAPSLSR